MSAQHRLEALLFKIKTLEAIETTLVDFHTKKRVKLLKEKAENLACNRSNFDEKTFNSMLFIWEKECEDLESGFFFIKYAEVEQ